MSKYTKYIPISLYEKLDEFNIYQKNLDFYEKYHKNIYNKIINIICIPNIVSSIFGLLNHFEHLLFSTCHYILSSSLFGTYIFIYITFAPQIIVKRTFFFYLFILLTTNRFYNTVDHKITLNVFLGIQVLGWLGQILSHKYIEKKSPAFMKGIIQSFVSGPIFIVVEIIRFFPLLHFLPISVAYCIYLMSIKN